MEAEIQIALATEVAEVSKGIGMMRLGMMIMMHDLKNDKEGVVHSIVRVIDVLNLVTLAMGLNYRNKS